MLSSPDMPAATESALGIESSLLGNAISPLMQLLPEAFMKQNMWHIAALRGVLPLSSLAAKHSPADQASVCTSESRFRSHSGSRSSGSSVDSKGVIALRHAALCNALELFRQQDAFGLVPLQVRRSEYYSLLTTHYSLLTTHTSLFTTHYSLLTTHYSLLTTHNSLLTTHYSPLTTH